MTDRERAAKVEAAKRVIERSGGKVGADRSVTHDNPGLKVLAAIDFLVNHAGYRWTRE